MSRTGDSYEGALRAEFRVRAESFRHRGFAAELLLPESSEALIDEADFERDERLPYWAELWPSAVGLAREILDGDSFAGNVLELGAGIGLPSLAAAWQGATVVASDYYEPALQFIRVNVERNGQSRLGSPLRVTPRLLDWRDPPPDLAHFPLALGADLLYERRNVETLLDLLPRILAPDGILVLADPGRAFFGEFLKGAMARGWGVVRRPDRDEASSAGEEIRSTIRIVEVRV